MLSYGFEKTGTLDYAKEATDGVTKIVVRAPDQTYGFGVGVQFRDFKTDYADYSGKFNKACMYYYVGALLQFAAKRDYSEEDMVDAVKTLMEKINIFLQRGKDAIYENIEEWIAQITSDQKKNDIYAYFGMPLMDPYTKEYQDELVEQMRGGGMCVLTMNEYLDHKEFYDAFKNYDSVNVEICIDERDDSVSIHFHPKPKWYSL